MQLRGHTYFCVFAVAYILGLQTEYAEAQADDVRVDSRGTQHATDTLLACDKPRSADVIYRITQVIYILVVLGSEPMTNDFYCDEALSGRTPVEIVRETGDVLAFHHTRPYWAVHIVVVPKVHVPSLTDLGGQDISIIYRLLDVVREVAAEIEAQYGGCRVATNLGRYQDSKHLHFHVGFGDPRK